MDDELVILTGSFQNIFDTGRIRDKLVAGAVEMIGVLGCEDRVHSSVLTRGFSFRSEVACF